MRDIQKSLSVLDKETIPPYGGRNLVLAGDHTQLKPVPRSPLYMGPTRTSNQKHLAGYWIYWALCKAGTICRLNRAMRSKNTAYIKL